MGQVRGEHPRGSQGWIAVGLSLLAVVLVRDSPAWAGPVDTAVNWLAATQRTDGLWSEAVPVQATAEVVSVLREVASTHPAIALGTAYADVVRALAAAGADLAHYKDGKDIRQSPIPPERLGAMLGLLANGTISGRMAKDFFDEMYATGADPADILKKKGGQISDPAEVEKIIREVLVANPGAVTEYRGGKEGAFNFLIGQVMKATRGKANPQLVNDLLKKALLAS